MGDSCETLGLVRPHTGTAQLSVTRRVRRNESRCSVLRDCTAHYRCPCQCHSHTGMPTCHEAAAKECTARERNDRRGADSRRGGGAWRGEEEGSDRNRSHVAVSLALFPTSRLPRSPPDNRSDRTVLACSLQRISASCASLSEPTCDCSALYAPCASLPTLPLPSLSRSLALSLRRPFPCLPRRRAARLPSAPAQLVASCACRAAASTSRTGADARAWGERGPRAEGAAAVAGAAACSSDAGPTTARGRTGRAARCQSSCGTCTPTRSIDGCNNR